jgi:hypothetical protein
MTAKELVTDAAMFLIACLPGPLIITPVVVLRTGTARSANPTPDDESDESVSAET